MEEGEKQSEMTNTRTYCEEGVLGGLEDSVFCQCMCNLVLGNNDILFKNLHCQNFSTALLPAHHNLVWEEDGVGKRKSTGG